MPVTRSAKKKARQAIVRTERNKGWRTKLKTFMKKVQVLSKTNVEDAKKLLPEAYSVIDTATKKHLIHKNNAARKKSLLARSVARGVTLPPKAKKEVVAKVAKAPKAKKVEAAAKETKAEVKA
jgi:small subunit ribosomal protein S20